MEAMIYRVSRCFLCRLAGISEQGTFHGITAWQGNKPLNIKDKNGLFIMERE